MYLLAFLFLFLIYRYYLIVYKLEMVCVHNFCATILRCATVRDGEKVVSLCDYENNGLPIIIAHVNKSWQIQWF